MYSKTLESVSSARTRIERSFDPDAIRQMKASAERDLIVDGGELAAHAFDAGLVDECYMFVAPAVVGAGRPAFPTGVPVKLDLVDERRFAAGMVLLHYRVRP